MSKKEQREFKESFDDLQRKAEEISKQGELLEKNQFSKTTSRTC
ncbi:hypothetical protein [Lactobacillus taiwanensis]|nr:hypothetical protein [Lactobacillus taiwanensis]